MAPFDPPLTLEEIQTAFGNRIQVKDPLATGGQAALFVVDFQGADAVLKIYKEAHTVRAERECKALERLSSDHIVRLLAWGSVALRGTDCVYTLTEFVQGMTLEQRLVPGPMSESEARKLGISVATAIGQVWTLDRIVHRDIKPKNIMMRPDGSAVILDLGIARHTNLETYTEWGVWLGTAGYMSPEQARGRKGLTFKSDFFTLGIVLYEAMAGTHPYQRDQTLIGNVNPKPLRRVMGASEEMSRIVHSLLSADPLDRPRSCEYLVAALQEE